MEIFTSVEGTPMRYLGNTLLPKSKRNFRKQSRPNRKEYSISRRVTIIDSAQADVIREKHSETVISSRLVLRWRETDTGFKARWWVHGFKDPDIHEIERSCPTPELSSLNITLQILASTTSEETLADGEKAFMQGDPSVRGEPHFATPFPEGLPGVPGRALIRLDREVSGMSGWRSRIVSLMKEDGYEMNVYEPFLFSKFAVREEPAVDGSSIAPGDCIWLCVARGGRAPDGWPWESTSREHGETTAEDQVWKVAPVVTRRAVFFFGGRHFTQLPFRSFKVDMTRFIRERLRPISLPRGRSLDRSAEASEGKE